MLVHSKTLFPLNHELNNRSTFYVSLAIQKISRYISPSCVVHARSPTRFFVRNETINIRKLTKRVFLRLETRNQLKNFVWKLGWSENKLSYKFISMACSKLFSFVSDSFTWRGFFSPFNYEGWHGTYDEFTFLGFRTDENWNKYQH